MRGPVDHIAGVPDAGAARGFTLVADSDPAEQLGLLRLELVIGEHAGVSQLAELAQLLQQVGLLRGGGVLGARKFGELGPAEPVEATASGGGTASRPTTRPTSSRRNSSTTPPLPLAT